MTSKMDIDNESRYLKLNMAYRKQLEEIVSIYTDLIKELLRRYNALKHSQKIEKETRQSLVDEYDTKTDILLQIQLNGDGDPSNTADIIKLNTEIEELKKQILVKNDEISLITSDATICKVHFEDTLNEATKQLSILKAKTADMSQDMQDVAFQNVSSDDQISAIKAQAEKMLRERSAKTATKIASAHGLYILVRFRCSKTPEDEKSIVSNEPNSITITNGDVPQKIVFNSDDAKSFIIYDDAGKWNCTQLLGIQGDLRTEIYDEARKQAFIMLENFQKTLPGLEVETFGNNVRKLNLAIVEHLTLRKTFFEKDFERTRYGGLKPGREDTEPQSANTKLTDFRTISRKLAGMIGERKLEDGEKILKYFDQIEKYVTMQANAYKYVMASGDEFILRSALDFLKKSSVDKPLKCITIIGMGATGSGKTTSTHAILLNIIHQYTTLTKLKDSLQEATITVVAKEVRQDAKNGIVINGLSRTPHSSITKNLKPFLIDRSTERSKDEDKITLCKGKNKRNQPVSCALLDGVNGYDMMKELIKYDMETEQNRDTRYTPDNPAGSSRSVKIIIITITRADGSQTKINLVDPPGYERYTTKDLTTFYRNLITQTMTLDPDYQPVDVEEAVKESVNNAEKEKLFIDQTLLYLRTSLHKYNELQNGEEFKHYSQKDFKEAMVKEIRQTPVVGTPLSGKETWIDELDLMPKDSSVIVLAAFKSFIPPKEFEANHQTFKFLEGLKGL